MNELQRMQYLDAMGVDMFVPRFVLPNAKLSQVCELPVAEISAPPMHRLTDSQGEAAPIGSEGGLISDIIKKTALDTRFLDDDKSEKVVDAKAESKVKQEEQVQSVQQPEPVAEPVRFNLSVWNSDQVLVLDSQSENQALPTETLLKNILIHAGLLTSLLPRAELIKWPPVALPDRDMGWGAALDWLTPYLEGKLFAKEKKIFIFGESCFNALTGGAEDFSQNCFSQVEIEPLSISALVLPSLADILYKPELKKQIWLAIQNGNE